MRKEKKSLNAVLLTSSDYVTNSDGAVTIIWKSGADVLESAPVNAGSYSVIVKTAKTAQFNEKSIERGFVISKIDVSACWINNYDPSKEYDGLIVPNPVYGADFVVYDMNNPEFTITLKSGFNEESATAISGAKDYYLYLYFVNIYINGDENHNAVNLTKSFRINKKSITLPPQAFQINAGDGHEFYVTLTDGVVEGDTVQAIYTFVSSNDGAELESVALSSYYYVIEGDPVATLHVHSYEDIITH